MTESQANVVPTPLERAERGGALSVPARSIRARDVPSLGRLCIARVCGASVDAVEWDRDRGVDSRRGARASTKEIERMRFLAAGWVVIAAMLASPALAGSCRVQSAAETVALVELYTSQGCSSCPPADRWLAALPGRFEATKAIPLSLHVGYWDYIGWKDPFAKPEFNERQRALAARTRAGVYTPEVFVGGAELYEWRTDAAFRGALDTVHARPAPLRIELEAQPKPGAIDVRASVVPLAAKVPEANLFIVLKQHGHQTDVRAGENRGEKLANDHVVRHWSAAGEPASARSVTIPLPEDGPRRFELVAFAQERRGGAILQAVALPLDGCEAAKADGVSSVPRTAREP
jgi:hypothetical protein